MNDDVNAPHSASLRSGWISTPGNLYLVTKDLLKRHEHLLSDPHCAEIVANSLIWMQENHLWNLLGFVVMPDHFHAVLHRRTICCAETGQYLTPCTA